MARDSKLWEQAYAARNFVPIKSKHQSVIQPQPMKLQHELSDINSQLKLLHKRRTTILAQLKKINQVPIRNEAFFSKPIFLYALRLEGNKYYIGMSRDVEKRFKKHLAGKGAAWTKAHRPLEIIEQVNTDLTDESDVAVLEDEMTFRYARMYGIESVRGGGYCQSKPKWPSEIFEPDLSWIA